MTEEDDVFLKAYNAKYPPAKQLSEDDFERIMEVFEETADLSTPYAAVDKSIAPYSDMVTGLYRLEVMRPDTKTHSKELYEYWKSRREACHGPLHQRVKLETHQETDEMDPYICFRRREIRQTRKTRARDVQSTDKLKSLRKELEKGRALIIESCERELQKREMLQYEKEIFDTRASLRELKVRLGIKTNDTDLWNQKVSSGHSPCLDHVQLLMLYTQEEPTVKKRAQEASAAQRAAANAARQPQRLLNAQSFESEMMRPLKAEKQRRFDELTLDLAAKVQNHTKWNRNHVDTTNEPLTPVRDTNRQPYRIAKAQFLMTPPASNESKQSLDEPDPMDIDDDDHDTAMPLFTGVVPEEHSQVMAFRRRVGRLGLQWIDRKIVSNKPPKPHRQDADPVWPTKSTSDRWTYDRDSSDDEVEEVDPYGPSSIRFRATIPLGFNDGRRKPPAGYLQAGQQESASAQQAAMLANAAARQGASAQRPESAS